ncbi:MAG: N-acetylmuramoyl-L-alanine amidase [Gemmatimonadaceae bacterium]
MTIALLLALQLADTLLAITIRDADRVTRVPIRRVGAQSYVSADQLAGPLGGVVRRLTPDRYTVTVGGTEFEISPGAPLLRVQANVVPLASAPRLLDFQLFVPLAFVSDVLPRHARDTTIAYDAARAELRRGPPAPAQPSTGASPGTAPAQAAATAAPPVLVRPVPKPKSRPVVVIDPGHGGPDRGMHGPLRGRWRVYEADLALQVARRLRDALQRSGVDVFMTRTRDTLIALADRGRIANDRKADLFLSLHVNAANPRWRDPASARGYETYFLSEARTDDARRVEELENSSIQYELDSLPKGDDALGFILNDMRQNESLRESRLLADAIQDGMGTVHPGPSRGVKQAGFRVLVAAIVPAVLVEIGFGTNVAEARFLASSDGQRSLANAIARATLGYLAAYERRRTQGDTAR